MPAKAPTIRLSRYNKRMETRLMNILVCPLCKGPLVANALHTELICKADLLAYPVRDGIPVMLTNEARVLNDTETV